MDRKALREFTHRAAKFLRLENTTYKQWVFRYTFLELEKDFGMYGDITSEAIFKDNSRVKARIVARENGILAGVDEIRYFLVESDASFRPRIKSDFRVDFKMEDGSRVRTGDVVMEISAGAQDLLAVERVVLNLLSRMSGVASFARKIVDMVAESDVLIAPTRKTLWGWLDKKAVLLGGGGTHRLSLSDAMIVKDSHLDIIGRDFSEVMKRIADSGEEARFVEIEVENVDEALDVSKRFCGMIDGGFDLVGVVMMDNMATTDVIEAIGLIKERGYHDQLLFEASGGICERNVVAYARTGVDILSLGCLTGGVKSLDFGLDIESPHPGRG